MKNRSQIQDTAHRKGISNRVTVLIKRTIFQNTPVTTRVTSLSRSPYVVRVAGVRTSSVRGCALAAANQCIALRSAILRTLKRVAELY